MMKLPGSIFRIFDKTRAPARDEATPHAHVRQTTRVQQTTGVEQTTHVERTTGVEQTIARVERTVPARAAETAPHVALGRRGEALAAAFLERAGYALVAANFELPVGRNLRGAIVRAEIDLVAYEGETLCFVEVKTRASDWFAAPEANVDRRKQRQITRAARVYRRTFGLNAAPYRYDVVSVILPPLTDAEPAPNPRIQLLRNFWTEAKFRKRRWSD